MDQRDLLLTSDYPMDKVVFIQSGSMTIAPHQTSQANIQHGLPYIPLVFGNYSLDPSYDTAYEYGSGPIYSDPAIAAFTTQPTAISNTTNIRVTATNYGNTKPITIYYRVYCFRPSNAPESIVPNTNIGVDPFMINTDQEQVQLMYASTSSFPDVPSSVYEQTVFTHSLGYRPQVMSWVERGGTIENLYQSSPDNGSVDIVVGTDSLLLRVTPYSLAGTVHYRVYTNE